MKILRFSVVLLGMLLIFSCQDSCKKNRFDVKKSDLKEDFTLKFSRLDRDLFSDSLKTVDEKLKFIKKRYPGFYPIYFQYIINLGDPDRDGFNVPLAGFLADTYIQKLYADASGVFGDLKPEKEKLQRAFELYHHFLPANTVPELVFCISGLNYAVAATDSVLAIGLDMYLGKDYEAYQALNFPGYITERKVKEYMPAEAVKGWLLTEFEKDVSKTKLIDEMVYYGKINFLLQALMPDEKVHILMGFTDKDYKFLTENESNIWGYFVENKLLYTDKKKEIVKYIEEAPFSVGMPKECPGRTGIYIGTQIVESYMEMNPNISLENLMQNNDLQAIFTQSKYKPKH